jgi:2-polyprenylphenol 6-hydroxylase
MVSSKQAKAVNCDVLVVGAGLVGLAAVIALAEQGKRVVLIDTQNSEVVQKMAFPQQDWDARIYALTPATEAFLIRLGVWSFVDLLRINAVEAMALWHTESDRPLNLFAEDARLSKLASIAESRHLMQALWKKLQALEVTVMSGIACRSLDYDQNSVIINLDNDIQVRASLLVAADGAQSFIRQTLAIATKTKAFNQTALVANYQVEKKHDNVARQWFASHETLALLPLPQQHVSMVWALQTPLAQTLLAMDDACLAEHVQTRTSGLLGELKPIGQTFSYELKQVTAERLIAQRVVLIGDAAHQVHPMAGQGANLGFRDVMCLENLIATSHAMQDIGDLTFLRQYERTRKADILNMNILTSGLDTLFSIESSVVKKITSFSMRQLDQHRSMKNILIQQAIA